MVEIDGISYPGFMSCSELKMTEQMLEHYEGGTIIPEKRSTRASMDDITLERAAATGDRELYDWFIQVVDGAANAGLPSPQYKRNLDIVQQERDGSEVRRWTVYGAWVKEYTAGSWDNTSDDATMEQIVLSADYFELTFDAGGA